MKTIQISLPNSLDNFILVEMCERLKEGQTVTMLFGGRSMLPLINGEGDKIQLVRWLRARNVYPARSTFSAIWAIISSTV